MYLHLTEVIVHKEFCYNSECNEIKFLCICNLIKKKKNENKLSTPLSLVYHFLKYR